MGSDVDRADGAFAAFRSWLAEIDRSAWPIVMLRHKRVDPVAAFQGDYDYIADPKVIPHLLEAALHCIGSTGGSVRIDQRAPHKTVLQFNDAAATHGIKVEIWPHAEMSLPSGRPAAIAWREFAPWWRREGSVPDTLLGLVYITHLHYKDKDLDASEVTDRIDRLTTALRSTGGPVRDLLQQLRSGEISAAEANAIAVRQLGGLGVKARPLRSRRPRALIRRGARRLRSRRQDPRIVPLLGPDGAGKTTLATQLVGHIEQTGLPVEHYVFKRTFRDWYPTQLLYSLSRRWHRRRPDRAPARNELDERYSHLLIATCLLRWPRVRARLVESLGAEHEEEQGVVLVDRYFWDYLIRPRDPGREDIRIPGASLYRRMAPRPQRLVVLVSPTPLLMERKAELTERAIASIYRFYCEQLAISRGGTALLVSTRGSPEQSVAEVTGYLGIPVAGGVPSEERQGS